MRKSDKKVDRLIESDYKKYRERKKRNTENKSTVDSVIDLRTTKTLKKLQANKIIGSITGTIASGKESNIYLAEKGDDCNLENGHNNVAIKIYRTSTLNFKQILPYIKGDRRFRRKKKGSYHLITLWAQKEFKNLTRAYRVGINVPKPIIVKNNVLVMEYLSINNIALPKAKDLKKNYSVDIINIIYDQIKVLVDEAKLVHGDLSEFNILIDPEKEKPFFIDMGQSVTLDHPMALTWLERDLKNVNNYFPISDTKYKNEIDFMALLKKNFTQITEE